jgi:colanic acid biosynthesis glycosyl transferase WcaI
MMFASTFSTKVLPVSALSGTRMTGTDDTAMRRKIIFVNRFFYPDESATSLLVTDLALDLARDQVAAHVICSRLAIKGEKVGAAFERFQGVDIHRVWTSRLGNGSLVRRSVDYLSFYPGAFVKLLRVAQAGDTIVVKTDPPLLLFVGGLAAKLKRARLINWLQDLYPEVGAELGIRLLRGAFGKFLRKARNIVLRRSAHNVAIGECMRDRLLAEGVSLDRTSVVQNWADDRAITPITDGSLRREWGVLNDAFVLGYSGNFGRAHESETLLSAARALRHRRDIIFLFVGGGSESARLREKVDADGLDNFIFKEHQPAERLGEALAVADIHWLSLRPGLEGLIVPSKFYGIAAAGRGVIAVIPENCELATAIRSWECGAVIEPGDSAALASTILDLSDDRAKAKAMGDRARQMLDSRYSRRAAMERWKALLRKTGALPQNRADGFANSIDAIVHGEAPYGSTAE